MFHVNDMIMVRMQKNRLGKENEGMFFPMNMGGLMRSATYYG